MNRKFAVAATALWLASAGMRLAAADEPKLLKLATLAPEGSGWMKLFHEWAHNIEEKSGGRIKVKLYAGGVAGDERDVVRKMRLGQLNGGAVTAIGLGLIQPEVRVLEVPFIMRSYDELDYVRNSLDGELRKKFEDKGYVLLGWGDVGPVHLFTNSPPVSKQALLQMKFWAWTDDPIVRTLFQEIGISGVPLGVPDVLPSLQTGMINACYGSPLSTLALQWQSKVKYITSMVISQSIGATVVTKKAWDDLGPELQKIVMDASKELEKKLLKTVRADNETALTKMKAQGLVVTETPPELQKEFQMHAAVVAQKLEGALYSHEFRARVDGLLATYRATHK